MNNDFGCDHKVLVTGQSLKSGQLENFFGYLHLIPVELQTLLINFAKKRAPKPWYDFNTALKRQENAPCQNEEITLQQKNDASQDDCVLAIRSWEQYHSHYCWMTITIAQQTYNT